MANNSVFFLDELNIINGGVDPDKLSSSDKDFDSLTSDHGFYRDGSLEEGISFSDYQQQRQVPFTNYGLLEGVSFSASSPPIQACLKEIAELNQMIPNRVLQDVAENKKENKYYPFPLSSLGLLNNYGSGFKRLHGEIKSEEIKADHRKLSTEEVMRVAGEMFIRSSSCQSIDSFYCTVGSQGTGDVELAVILLAAAEKVGYRQYDRASRLLKQCDNMLFKTGNPVQRVVYHFSEALRERIERETGRGSSKALRTKPVLYNFDEAMMKLNPTALACHEELPFSQITQFAGVQAIVENVTESKRIHIIDLAIRSGVPWTILMQALASSRRECPVELLKITAVATDGKHLIEETGKRLSSFAESMSLPFSFKIVMVSDMLDLKQDLFELDAEETIAVYAAFAFRTMLATPNRIENIMRVIKAINPVLMVVSEIEANHNSPVFVNRFIEALFFYSAYFDCTATCMKQNCKNREIIESMFFGEGIRNVVAVEGEERKVRNVKLDVWRAFFVRYGMEEAEFSMSSLYQAELILKTFACWSSCTLSMNGKCLLVGWKGTPMHSISVWKFH